MKALDCKLILEMKWNEDGFLKNPNDPTKDARLIFQAKYKTVIAWTDYHDEITCACLEEWFQKVLGMLLSNSDIFMDNSS